MPPKQQKRKTNPGQRDKLCPPLKTRVPVTDHPTPCSPTLPDPPLRPDWSEDGRTAEPEPAPTTTGSHPATLTADTATFFPSNPSLTQLYGMVSREGYTRVKTKLDQLIALYNRLRQDLKNSEGEIVRLNQELLRPSSPPPLTPDIPTDVSEASTQTPRSADLIN